MNIQGNNEFKSNKNKEIVWNLLNECGAFKDLNNSLFPLVKQQFEQTILKCSTYDEHIMDLNKRVLQDMLREIARHKSHYTPELISAADVSASRQAEFQKGLQNKQNEFSQMINKTVPNKIDFSDSLPNLEELPMPVSEMDKKLAEAIAWREQQMNIVNASQAKPPIIGGSAAAAAVAAIVGTNTNTNINTSRHLKIGAVITQLEVVNLKSIPATKKVSFIEPVPAAMTALNNIANDDAYNPFSDANNASSFFLSKLKKKRQITGGGGEGDNAANE